MIRESWGELRRYLDGRSSRLLLLSVIATVSGMAEALALMLAARVAIGITADHDVIEIGSQSLSVPVSLSVALVAELVAFVGHALIARLSAQLSATVLRVSRRDAVQRYIDASWAVQSTQRQGALQDLVTTLTLRTSELAQHLSYGLSQLISSAMFVIAALVVDWRLTAAIIVAGVVAVFFLRPVARITQVKAREFVKSNGLYAEEIAQLSSASMELKSFGVEPIAAESVEQFNIAASNRSYEARFAALFANGVFKDVAILLLIGSVAGLYWLGQEALSSAGVVIMLIIRGLASVQAASSEYQNAAESAPNLAILNERLAAMQKEVEHREDIRLHEFESLDLVHVSFAYDSEEYVTLEDVNLTIKAGEFLGIVGPSGGGKSTLLQLLLRLRVPSTGSVLIDGHDYQNIATEDWHELVSFVPQEPTLIEGTIAENIAFYRPISRQAIEAAAKSANIFGDVASLPLGFETKLGPRGSGLSGGQKQRIAIARALAGGPSLLVMDEPTSALDATAEDAVLESIARLRGKTTLVLVAHRMSTVADCDYLVEVKDGTVTPRSKSPTTRTTNIDGSS